MESSGRGQAGISRMQEKVITCRRGDGADILFISYSTRTTFLSGECLLIFIRFMCRQQDCISELLRGPLVAVQLPEDASLRIEHNGPQIM